MKILKLVDTLLEGGTSIIYFIKAGLIEASLPHDFSPIYQLIQEVLKYDKILLHCSAGWGRSGVIAAIISFLTNDRS